MREIKFRAWIKDYALMTDVNFLNIDYKEIVVMIDKNDYVLRCGEYELMQFTGLYDKHHKPIYEGDIVSYFGLKYEVLFKNGAFGWMEDGEFYSFNEMARSEFNKFEIIGNVYENPELLEESK